MKGLSLSDDRRRRALCLGVDIAPAPTADPVEEPDPPEFAPLPFAVRAAQELAAELARRAFAVTCVVDAEELSGAKLGARVNEFLRSFTASPDQVAVVHVLGHGTVGQSRELRVVGSDARTDAMTGVRGWQDAVTDNGPLTLFLLDLCHAGAATRGWEAPRAERDETERAWVIGATGAEDPAYAGRFTRAVTAVLRDLWSRRYDLDDSVAWVPFNTLYTWIKQSVLDLAAAEGGQVQYVVCTASMGDPPELPFVPNPHYRTPTRMETLATEVEPATAEFLDPLLDPVMDASHFQSRASGHARATGDFAGGAFRGRAPQLSRLAQWFDDPADRGEAIRRPAGLMLVRGSPGSGKSALLGVCVCAAHPRLRVATAELWQVAAHRPSLHPNLAAVHARQYDLAEITASLSRQLVSRDGGPYPSDDLYPGHTLYASSAPRNPDELIAEIARLPAPPIVVIDALDESLDPGALIDQLLLPLAQATRDDEQPACRLLLGTRPWSAFARLLDYAEHHAEVLDLDAIPTAQRRADLADYVAALLELHPDLPHAATAGPREAFARAVATTLTADPTAQHERSPTLSRVLKRVLPPPDSAGSDEPDAANRWGETLVAALFTYQAARFHRVAFDSVDSARTLGMAAPTTLPEVLELDLGQRSPSPWRRALLASLAHAAGDGIPLKLLTAVTRTLAAVFEDTAVGTGGVGVALNEEEVAAELGRLRFYLRSGVDSDGSTVYRLFHQGLADYLQRLNGFTGFRDTNDRAAFAGHRITQLVFDSLLHSVPQERDMRRWDLSAPYVRRHLPRHAADAGQVNILLADAGFLVHADQAGTRSIADLASSEQARNAATVYRNTLLAGRQGADPEAQRDLLAVNATRLDARELSRLLLTVPGIKPPLLVPRWATGHQVARLLRMTVEVAAPSALASTVLDGHPFAITGGDDGALRVWDLITGRQHGEPIAAHLYAVQALATAVLRGLPVAITADYNTLRVWDLTTGRQHGQGIATSGGVNAVLATVLGGRPVVITAARGLTLRIWDLATGRQHGRPIATGGGFAVGVTMISGYPVAITADFGRTLRFWDLATGREHRDSITAHGDLREPMATTVLDDRPVAITGGDDRALRVWDLTTGRQRGDALTGHTARVRGVATTVLNDRPVAISAADDGTMRVWELSAAAPPTRSSPASHIGEIRAVATTVVDGRPVAISAGDGALRVWDLITGRQRGDALGGHTPPIWAVATTVLDGRPVAVSAGDGSLQVWDLTTGRQRGKAITNRTGQVRMVATTVLDGQPVAISAGSNRTLRVWDLDTGRQRGKPIAARTTWTRAMATAVLDDRPVAVTAGDDRTLRVWDLTSGRQRGDALTGHTGAVRAVATTMLDDRPVAITGGDDHTLRVWDLTTGRQRGDALTGHTGAVRAVATTMLDDRPVAITGGDDHTLRVWDLISAANVGVMTTPERVSAVAWEGDAVVCGMGWDIVSYELSQTWRLG